jgi:SAM-dependent methyltransferase
MNPFIWAIASAKQRGIVRTTRIAGSVVTDLLFDWKYGTDTVRWVDKAALDATSDNRWHAVSYQATKARPFLSLLRQLDLPTSSVFVDIGCGKGRVVLIASQYGFRKVVGIDFSSRLCAVARNNVELFSKKTNLLSPIEVVDMDVAGYQFRADECVLYMFNPFDSLVMTQVVENIRQSLEHNPRRMWVIYNTPTQHDVLMSAGLFKSVSAYEISGNEFRVYTNC